MNFGLTTQQSLVSGLVSADVVQHVKMLTQCAQTAWAGYLGVRRGPAAGVFDKIIHNWDICETYWIMNVYSIDGPEGIEKFKE